MVLNTAFVQMAPYSFTSRCFLFIPLELYHEIYGVYNWSECLETANGLAGGIVPVKLFKAKEHHNCQTHCNDVYAVGSSLSQ